MGKRYHCEYCDKTMVATPAIVKTHNKGTIHQKLVQEHYQQFKDPETILAEESRKKPCSRFAQGTCQFGSICRFSHYTQEQIADLRALVASKNKNLIDQRQPSFYDLYKKLQSEKSTPSKESDNTIMCDRNGFTYIFPWTYNEQFDGYNTLPPSVKRVKIEDFYNSEAVYIRCVRGNTFIEEPIWAEGSESSDQDTESDLYRVILGNADSEDDTPQFKDTRKDLSLRSQFKGDPPKDPSHILRSQIKEDILRQKQAYRQELDERKTRNRLQIGHAKHMKRISELHDFMKGNAMSTEYFYSEMNRIKRQHMIKDSLRKMVEYVEKKPPLKKKILKCYYDLRDLEPKRCQLLKCKKPNTLVINDIGPNY